MKHPYHIVDGSPWPLSAAVGSFFLTLGLASWLSGYSRFDGIVLLLSSSLWWRDVCREATFQGKHTSYVVNGLRLGMLFFIASEVAFFFSFFWAFFHSSLAASWPPVGIEGIDPLGMPLYNTVLLLSSGASVTWAHHCVLQSAKAYVPLMLTILLGIMFTMVQVQEYLNMSFTMSDGVFGSVFYISTGFHGLHVIVGTLFLFVSLVRLSYVTCSHHVGFEAGAWYWHFVDVVWLFLYVCVYWWGF